MRHHSNQDKGFLPFCLTGFLIISLSFGLFATTGHANENFSKIEDVDSFVKKHPIDENNLELYEQLGFFFTENKQKEKALKVYKAVLEFDKDTPENWKAVIYGHYGLNQKSKGNAYLKEYIRRFPNDQTLEKELVSYYLYEAKRIDKLPRYERYIRKYKDPSLATDVGYLLYAKGKESQALTWLEKYQKKFPKNKQIEKAIWDLASSSKNPQKVINWTLKKKKKTTKDMLLLAESYDQLKAYKEAVNWYEKYYAATGQNTAILKRIAEIHITLRNRDKADFYIKKLVASNKNDYTILKWAGKEAHSIGDYKQALKYFYQSKNIKESDPEIWFWIAESAASDGDKEIPLIASSQVVTLWQEKPRSLQSEVKDIAEETRIILKSQGRLEYSELIKDNYKIALQKFPRNFLLRQDFLDFLIRYDQLELADEILADTKKNFPQDTQKLSALESELALKEERWNDAVFYVEKLLKKEPNNRGWRQDRAWAYWNQGNFRRSRKDYLFVREDLRKKNVCCYRSEDLEWDIVSTLQSVHDRYDFRITPHFTTGRESGDPKNIFGLDFNGYLTDNLQFQSYSKHGEFIAQSLGFKTVNATREEMVFTYHLFPNWSFSGGLTIGSSDTKDIVWGPVAQVRGVIPEWFSVYWSYKHSHLEMSLPTQVANGSYQNILAHAIQLEILERFVAIGRYEYTHDNISTSSASADTHKFEPEFIYMLSRERPYLAFSIHYQYLRLNENGGFLAIVPLLASVNELSFILTLSDWILDCLYVEFSARTSHDNRRGLSFVENFNISGLVRWRPFIWLEIFLRAEYSKASSAVAGDEGTHNINGGISFHWG